MWPAWRDVSKKACGVINEVTYAKTATSQKGTLPSTRLCRRRLDVHQALLGSLKTTTTSLSTTTGSEIYVNAQAQLANAVVLLSSTTSQRAV